jgi:hypothetical protein
LTYVDRKKIKIKILYIIKKKLDFASSKRNGFNFFFDHFLKKKILTELFLKFVRGYIRLSNSLRPQFTSFVWKRIVILCRFVFPPIHTIMTT